MIEHPLWRYCKTFLQIVIIHPPSYEEIARDHPELEFLIL